jgi:Lon protease-like protein
MGSTDRYQSVADLPASIPVFPLSGALLLPRCQLPLNIFEPRYLQMVDDTLRGGRIIGLVQPDDQLAPLGPDKPALMSIGCAGRLTSYTETLDGRTLITLTGIVRFRIVRELETTTPYRQCAVDWEEFADDLKPEFGADAVSRERLLDILKQYLDTHGLQADWRTIKLSTNETLVNSLSLISPYGPREKQALLEAKTLEDRNQMLIALTEVALQQISPSETTVQ